MQDSGNVRLNLTASHFIRGIRTVWLHVAAQFWWKTELQARAREVAGSGVARAVGLVVVVEAIEVLVAHSRLGDAVPAAAREEARSALTSSCTQAHHQIFTSPQITLERKC